jgi:hypothetical protein
MGCSLFTGLVFFRLVRCYSEFFFVVSCRRFGTVYQSNLQLSCVRTALPLEMGDGLSLKMGLIDHPETSVSNYKVTLSNHTREGLESSKSKHAEF